jgi:hypothetical protein
MILNSPYISGSLTVTGNEVVTGSLTVLGGITGAITGSATSASFATNASLLNGTGSGDFTSVNSFNSYTSSNNATVTSVAASTALALASIATLTSRTGSYTTTSSFNSYTSSNDANVNCVSLTATAAIVGVGALASRTGSYATTGSNTFAGGQYLSSSFNPTGFSTTASLYTDGGLRVTRDAYISGTLYLNNVTVFGTQSVAYISSSQLNIGTNLITVNTDTPSIRFGGLAVYDSGSTGLTGSILWDSQNNHWIYSNPSGSSYSGGMFISGPRTSTLGSETGTTSCMLLAGQGGDHLTSSMIYHDSTVTCFHGNSFISSSGAACFGSSITMGGNLNLSYSYPRINLIDTDNNSDYSIINADGNFAIYDDTNGANRLFINSSGNVGIGNSSPNAQLESYTACTTLNNDLLIRTEGGFSGCVSPSLSFGTGGQGSSYIRQAQIKAIGDNSYSSNLTFWTQVPGTSNPMCERVRITSGGNVGIGTSTPSDKLVVESSDNYITSKSTSNVAGFKMINTSGTSVMTQVSNALVFDHLGTERMRITSGGDLELKGRSTTTDYQAVFYNDNSQFAINATNTSTGKTINFNPSNTFTAMAITSTGNVGIGTTPSLWANGTESALQIKKASIYEYGNYEVGLQVNAFYNTDVAPAGWKYISTSAQCISQLQLSGGDLSYNIANPGTAGCGITWSTKFNITRAGLVGIGTATTPKAILSVEQDITTTAEFGSFGQFIINGKTNANKLLSFGFNTATDVGFIQAMVNGTSYNNLLLNLRGGNVGIGTTCLTQRFTIAGSYVRMESRSTDNTNAGVYYTVYNGTSVVGQSTQAVTNTGDYLISTGTSSETERFRITGTGNTCIFCQLSIGPVLTVGNQGGTDTTIVGGGSGVGSLLRMNYAGGTMQNLFQGNGDNYVNCFTGKLNAAGGVKFGGGATTLNYYEQGTWTPRVTNGSFTTNAGTENAAWYVRVGNIVTVGGTLNWSGGSGAQDGNSLRIACLPFAANNTANYRSVGQFGAPATDSIGFKNACAQMVLVIDPGASFIYIIQAYQNGTYLTYRHDPLVANAGTLYGFQATYITG